MTKRNEGMPLPESGQYKFIKSILSNEKQFAEVQGVLHEGAFGSDALKRIVKIINQFYEDNNKIPTLNDIKYTLMSDMRDDLVGMKEAKEAYINILNESPDGMITAYNEAYKYLQQQTSIETLNKTIKSLQRGFTVEKIEDCISELRSVETVKSDDSMRLIDILPTAFTEKLGTKVPTYIDEIDNASNGGLYKGSVGLLIAGTGVGKTTFFSIMAALAARNGNNVLHIFFEDNKEQIARKYISTYTGEAYGTFQNMSSDESKCRMEIICKDENLLDVITKNVRLKPMPNGTTQPNDIENEIKRLEIAEGWKPDVVFIDYLSCMQSSSDKRIALQQEHAAWESCMKKIESIANRENIAIWVAQQTNREGENAQTNPRGMSVIQGSYRVTQPASMILYLNNLNVNDSESANLHLEKCRYGKPTNWDNIFFDRSRCQVLITEDNEQAKQLEYIFDADSSVL